MNGDEPELAPEAAAAAPVQGLRSIYGAASGGTPATWDYVGQKLRELYIDNSAEKERRAEARKRDDLYDGKSTSYIEELINAAFDDPKNKELRSKLLKWSGWNNVIKRIVHEKATVYSEPATRRIANGDEIYQRFLERLHMDAVMREVNRKLVLHEDVYVQYRVRSTPRGRQPVVDVISPASFWAIHHPRDRTMLVGIILDQSPCDGAYEPTAPAYRVWTDAETFMLDGAGRVMEETVETWSLGRIPGVLATTRPATTKGALLAHCPSADLVAAHTAIQFLHLLLLKESKSKNRQTYLSGDISNAVMGQQADTENDNVLPEGVTVQSVDRGLDLGEFRETSTYVFDDAGGNHGLPPSVLHHRDATSGAEVHLRRQPIRQLREEQIVVMRDVERELFEVECGVNAMTNAAGEVELAEFVLPADALDTWGIDYGEVQEPVTTAERNANFETERRLGLTDTAEEKLKRDRDLKTIDASEAKLDVHTARETRRVAQLKTLQALNGSSSSAPGEATPQENGEAGRDASRS